MMDVELKLEQPLRRHAVISALVMGIAYVLGKHSRASIVANMLRRSRRHPPNDPLFCDV
jgi:hypothetical protein